MLNMSISLLAHNVIRAEVNSNNEFSLCCKELIDDVSCISDEIKTSLSPFLKLIVPSSNIQIKLGHTSGGLDLHHSFKLFLKLSKELLLRE